MSSTFAPSTLPQVAPSDPTKHVRFTLGMVLGVDDFNQQYTFHSGQALRIVRDLVGYGVVSGLRVTVDVDERGPRVQVAPGEAVTPSGRFVCVTPAQCAYLNDWLRSNRRTVDEEVGSPPAAPLRLAVVACYRECPTDDVPVPGEPCRSDAELMEASRLKESFTLELRPRAPAQLEEDAVRLFVAWLRRLPLADIPGGDVDDFVEAVRQAASLESSPPSSPPGHLLDFLVAPPPPGLEIPRARAPEYVNALFRFWVEDLRPRLRSAIPGAECGCSGAMGELDPDAECVLLAELEVPLAFDLSGAFVVADTPAVAVDESARPELVHLRLLQEWLLAGGTLGPGTVVSGRVRADGTVAASTGGLTAAPLAPTLYLLGFPGYSASAELVVLGQPLGAFADAAASTFELIPSADPDLAAALGSPPAAGVVVRVRRSDGTAVPDGFMVRIEELA